MMDGFLMRALACRIDVELKSEIPQETDTSVGPSLVDNEPYIDVLAMEDRTLAYVFLLDKEGTIRWTEEGMTTSDYLEAMVHATRALLEGA
jgi:hypothetical protein